MLYEHSWSGNLCSRCRRRTQVKPFCCCDIFPIPWRGVVIVGCGKREARVSNWSMAMPEKAAPVRGINYLEGYLPCAGGLSAVNAIGTQLRNLIKVGTDDPMAVGGIK